MILKWIVLLSFDTEKPGGNVTLGKKKDIKFNFGKIFRFRTSGTTHDQA